MPVEDNFFEKDYMPENTDDEQGLDDSDLYEDLINSISENSFLDTE